LLVDAVLPTRNLCSVQTATDLMLCHLTVTWLADIVTVQASEVDDDFSFSHRPQN